MSVEEGWVDENHIDSSKPYEGESSQSIDDKATRVVPLGNSDIPDSEAKTKHDDAFVSVDVSAPHESFDTMDDTTITGETESQDGGKNSTACGTSGETAVDIMDLHVQGSWVVWVEFLRSIGRFVARVVL
ncbi:hypothetical protein OIU74_000198 [Salix koriyanagi]|uniref:Uncharacterized protein n=1 Tax=Salix koriyanagi TaxID=2511006 RepID=A0A9Q0WZ94_9ROSI|nr:hypothetical protein OIU74_000198 [Salix koriyanagi]